MLLNLLQNVPDMLGGEEPAPAATVARSVNPVSVPLPGRFMWASWLSKLPPLPKPRKKVEEDEEEVVEAVQKSEASVAFLPPPSQPAAEVAYHGIRIPVAPDLAVAVDEDAELRELVELLAIVDVVDVISRRGFR